MKQEVVWETMVEFRCPPCSVDDHWNHALEDGACRSIERIHEQVCACSWRADEVIESPAKGGATHGQTT